MANINELNLNKTQDFNEYIEKSMRPMIKEILKHFCNRYRNVKTNDKEEYDPYAEDARYLYSLKEVEVFQKMYMDFQTKQKQKYNLLETEEQRKNFHWIATLKIENVYEDNSSDIYCYRISRVEKESK